jgi:hypothetical protein
VTWRRATAKPPPPPGFIWVGENLVNVDYIVTVSSSRAGAVICLATATMTLEGATVHDVARAIADAKS